MSELSDTPSGRMRLTKLERRMLLCCATMALADEFPDDWTDKDIKSLKRAIEKLQRSIGKEGNHE